MFHRQYLTNKNLIKEQLGLYRSYYPVEFGSNQKAKIIEINPNELTLTEKNQSNENVQSIKNALQNEEELPPPIIDENDTVLDGHHRVIAAIELNIKTIPVIQLYEPE